MLDITIARPTLSKSSLRFVEDHSLRRTSCCSIARAPSRLGIAQLAARPSFGTMTAATACVTAGSVAGLK